MQWTVPGTVLQIDPAQADTAPSLFRSMFLAGDISLGQIVSISGLEPYIVQNWVKRGFLAPPVGKRYSINLLSRVLIINMLRGTLPMEQICGLLTYINGVLDDESDDLIDDSQLYFLFIRLAARSSADESVPDDILAEYTERIPGAKERLRKVLNIMLVAWQAASLQQRAQQMVNAIYEESV